MLGLLPAVPWARLDAFILGMGAIWLPEMFRLQEWEVFPLALAAVGHSVLLRAELFLRPHCLSHLVWLLKGSGAHQGWLSEH